MSTRHRARALNTPLLSIAAVAGLALAGLGIAAPASAAEQNVSGVSLTWGLNAETGAGAYNGSCNFLSAGTAGNTQSSRAWTEADGFYKSSDGNVKVMKNGPSGDIAATWDNKCQTGAGTPVSPSGTAALSGNKLVLSNGSGTVDPTTGTATISWTGSFTSVFYGGLTYWSAKNPVLTVSANGNATLKATASGYGADQGDASVWTPIAEKSITLANLKNVSIDPDGFTVTPEYLGVLAPASVTNQNTTVPTAGAFPADFLEFQAATGTQPYWYSSGGGADPRKATTPLSVGWTVDTEPAVPGDDKNIDVDVKVPETVTEPEGPGAFAWTIAGAQAGMGTAKQNAAGGFAADGSLPAITVEDTRTASTGWTLNGKASAFASSAGTFPGSALGWAPSATAQPGSTITTGGSVAAGDPGLGESRTLAGTSAAGSGTLGAALQLLVPAGTPAGSYTSTLTITAISD